MRKVRLTATGRKRGRSFPFVAMTIRFFLVLVTGATIVWSGFLLVSWGTGLPIVVKSWSSQECLYIEAYSADGVLAKHNCGWEKGRKLGGVRWVK